MSLQSMTGFARETGSHGSWRFAWEIRSVNGRGLEVKFKLPAGFEALAETLRRAASGKLHRGSLFAVLNANRETQIGSSPINEPFLDSLIEAAARVARRHNLPPPEIAPLLAVRGVAGGDESGESEEARDASATAFSSSFAKALDAVIEVRAEEGARLEGVLAAQLQTIERLTEAAEACPARQPAVVRERLAKQVRELLEVSKDFDPDRLHQEAVLMASRADVREEIDRLHAHVAAARELLAKGGAVGRRLDFLAQEFSREVNTLTAKANDVSLSRIGLELKSVVEQWREQVQNVE
ncbi:MAG: YicC family protein [Hyphomicrobiales bacterium]|nr:YicC family protein [Hyphomicrobiales bacterium]